MATEKAEENKLADVKIAVVVVGVSDVDVIGLIAHTCIEATVRFAAELGYEVTVVRDATDYSNREMHDEIVDSISSLETIEMTAQ